MDQLTALVIVIVVLCLLALVIFWRNKGKTKVKLGNRLGTFEASSENQLQDHAIKLEDAHSEEGSINAEDNTGKGAHLTRVKAKSDINVTVTDLKKKQ